MKDTTQWLKSVHKRERYQRINIDYTQVSVTNSAKHKIPEFTFRQGLRWKAYIKKKREEELHVKLKNYNGYSK